MNATCSECLEGSRMITVRVGPKNLYNAHRIFMDTSDGQSLLQGEKVTVSLDENIIGDEWFLVITDGVDE